MTGYIVAFVLFVLVWQGVKRLAGDNQPRHTAPPPVPDDPIPRIRGDGRFAVDVVGESFYRSNLSALFGLRKGDADDIEECTAELRLDNNNPHDSQAVAVYIRDKQVGHLAKDMARDFRQAIKRDKLAAWSIFRVDAQVYIPDDSETNYSVMLDLPQA